MSALHIVILAGGQGARLGGVCKAGLRIGGQPLLARVAAALGRSARPLLISTGLSFPPSLPLPAGAIAVPDADAPPMGPLAGLARSARFLRERAEGADILVSVAVDTPFLPPDFVDRLGAALRASPAAHAAWGDNFYPTNAAWRLETLWAALAAWPQASSPKALLTAAGATAIDWRGTAAQDPFANLNTLADLMALQNRARRASRP